MTTRNDVDVDFNTSPRVAEIREPSTEIIMQDLVDTLRKQEDAFGGMTFRKLINASGKEDLGGGVKVGITVAMQNLLLAFAGRTTPAEVGTVTGVPASPVSGQQIMQDSAAIFITNNVQRGSLLINFTDQSVADVISVDSETQLTTKTLVEGITNTYTVLDDYKVWNIVQVSATGGNLVAVDDVQAVIKAVLPTAFTQVVLTSSASATLAEQADIQYASFNGGVWVDITGTTTGTEFPTGTERQPVNNFNDAITIAEERGFLTIYVISDALVDNSNDFTNYRFRGAGQNLTTLTLDPDAIFVNSTFLEASITGTLDGDAQIEDCIIKDLTFVSGVIENCILDAGTIILGGAQTAHFINCASGVPGASTPIIDMGGSGQALALRNYNGGVEIRNKTGADQVSIDLNSGHVILDSTVTTGTIIVRGVGKLTDNSVGATVVNELVSGVEIQDIHGQVKRCVYINTEALVNGNGYQQTPFDNWTDAVDFAEANGLRHFMLLGDATVDRQLKNFVFRGVGSPTIDANNQILDGCDFNDLQLDGIIAAGSKIHAHGCELRNGTTGLQGAFTNCGFGGVLTLATGSQTTMIDCYSSIGGLNRPTININGGAANVSIRSYRGGLTIKGIDNAGDGVTVSMSQGKLTLDNTNTNGVISVRGVAQFTDNSAGSAVDIDGLIEPDQLRLMQKITRNKMTTDPDTGILTIYDDDGTTVLLSGNIYEDVLASQIYRGRGAERRERLT